MDVSVPLLWILYIYLGFVHGDSDSNYKENTIPVDITYNHGTTDRDFVNVKVTPQTGSDVISLRLSRVKRNILSPSLLVVTQDGLVEDILNSDSMQLTKDKTFYKDKENTSAFSIDWNDGQINKVQGHFVKDGFLHSVISNNESVEGQESTRSKGSPRSSDGVGGHVALPHSMSKFTMPINLTGDTIYFNESTIYTKQSRRRRQTEDPQQLYVEYVAVTDFKNYLKWKADLNALNMTAAEKDLTTKYNMLEFYQHVVHGIDVIFKTLSSQDLQVEIVLTGLVICNESDICPWSEKNTICPDCDTVDDKECLYDFSKWRRNVLTNLLDHDHAALFTGYDLYYTLIQSKKTVGLAYMSNMCQNGSVSLVEERRNALSIHIAAHELGHSFGSHHDGTVATEACSEDDKYLMAPSMLGVTDPAKASHPWWFSPCSRADIYEYIESLDRNYMNCMLNVPSIYTPGLGDGTGLTYLPDDQCKVQYGSRSAVCREYHVDAWSSICYSMACRIPDQGECTLIYPHDGTPCGHMRWCQQGICEYSGTARDVDELCPLGDDPNYVCSESDCDGTIHMRAHCCQTCRYMMPVVMTTYTVPLTTRDTAVTTTTLSVNTTPLATTVAMATPTDGTTATELTILTKTDENSSTITMAQRSDTTNPIIPDTSPYDSSTVVMTTPDTGSKIINPTIVTTSKSSQTWSLRQSPSASQTTPKRHPSTTTHQTMPTRHHNMSTHPKTTPSGHPVTSDQSGANGSTLLPTKTSSSSTYINIHDTTTQSSLPTTDSATDINKITANTNDIDNKSTPVTTPAPTSQFHDNSHVTSVNLHNNTTNHSTSNSPSNDNINYTSSKPTSTNAGFAPTDTGAASTSTLKPIISKSTTSDPSQNSTSLSKFNISTDTPMDSSTSSTVSNSTVTVNSNTSTINSTGALEISTNMNSHIQQTTPSYNATDNISYSTKSRSVTSMQNSTVLPDGDDNVIDKLKPTPKIPSNIGTKFTTRMSFDSTTDRADANLLNKASNIQDSNFFLIVTSFTLFHKFVLFYTS